MDASNDLFSHEVEHGKYLASGCPEEIWGWGTPAGQLRAKRRAALILEGAEIGPSSRVIEIGCGTGMFTAMFAESGADIVAVDLSPDLLAERRKGISLESGSCRRILKIANWTDRSMPSSARPFCTTWIRSGPGPRSFNF